MANRPPSSWTIGRRSGGITGTQSRTMPIGELRVDWNAATTLSRLSARSFFWPLPDRMVSRSDVRLAVEVEVLQQPLQRLGAHAAVEVLAEPVAQLAIQHLVRDQRLRLQLAEGVQHLVQPVDLALRAVADLAHLPLAALAHLAAHVGLRTLALQLGEVGLELLLPCLDVTVALVLGPLLLDRHLGLDGGQVAVARLGVDRGDQVRREVDDLLEVLGSQVEQVAEPARDTLEVPDVGDRRGQLDVTHPLPAHLGPGDLDAAALADDALEPDPLVLAAVALPVPGRTEDLLAEEPVLLRLERAVVDRLGLLDLAVRPLPDVLAGRQADTELVEEVHVQHFVLTYFPFGSRVAVVIGCRPGR